jgi:hypothetical protein
LLSACLQKQVRRIGETDFVDAGSLRERRKLGVGGITPPGYLFNKKFGNIFTCHYHPALINLSYPIFNISPCTIREFLSILFNLNINRRRRGSYYNHF